MAICPICGAEAKPRKENPCFPFCNARCKTIDLGKWMNEDYRLQGGEPEDEESADDEDPTDEIVRH